MKEHTPTERVTQLNNILKYDSELKEHGKAGHFSVAERIMINQERGQIYAGKDNFCHKTALSSKIQFVIKHIEDTQW